MSPEELGPEKGCSGDAEQKLKTKAGLLVRAGAPHQQIRNYLKIIQERRINIGRRSQMDACHQDGLAD
jgi:hypothetical protein